MCTCGLCLCSHRCQQKPGHVTSRALGATDLPLRGGSSPVLCKFRCAASLRCPSTSQPALSCCSRPWCPPPAWCSLWGKMSWPLTEEASWPQSCLLTLHRLKWRPHSWRVFQNMRSLALYQQVLQSVSVNSKYLSHNCVPKKSLIITTFLKFTYNLLCCSMQLLPADPSKCSKSTAVLVSHRERQQKKSKKHFQGNFSRTIHFYLAKIKVWVQPNVSKFGEQDFMRGWVFVWMKTGWKLFAVWKIKFILKHSCT